MIILALQKMFLHKLFISCVAPPVKREYSAKASAEMLECECVGCVRSTQGYIRFQHVVVIFYCKLIDY
jgi:hypothetical protein